MLLPPVPQSDSWSIRLFLKWLREQPDSLTTLTMADSMDSFIANVERINQRAIVACKMVGNELIFEHRNGEKHTLIVPAWFVSHETCHFVDRLSSCFADQPLIDYRGASC